MARHTEIVRYTEAFLEYSEADDKELTFASVEARRLWEACLRNIDQGSTVTLLDIMEDEW